MTNPPGSVSSVEVVVRPNRWFLLVGAPTVLVLTPLWVIADRRQLTATFFLGIPVVVLLWTYVIFTLVGRTAVGPDGIRNRMLGGERHLAWDEIEAFEIRRGVFGRTLKIITTDGAVVELAAPRDRALPLHPGFDETVAAFRRAAPADLPLRTDLAPSSVGAQRRAGWITTLVLLALVAGIASFFDQPWKSPYWPGRHEAAAIPSACDALRTPSAMRLIPSGTPMSEGPVADPQRSECTLDDPRGDRRIRVDYDLSEWEGGGGDSASDVAHRAFALEHNVIPSSGSTSVRGLGDEAQVVTRTLSGDTTTVGVVVRRANVVLKVDYLASEPPRQVTADAEQVARVALDLIRVA